MIFFLPVLVLICAFLWAWGGAQGTSKNWRRLGVPCATALAAMLSWKLNGWYVFLAALHWLALWGSLTVGYGESSPLADIVRDILKTFEWEKVNIVVRAVVGSLYGACCGLLCIGTGHVWAGLAAFVFVFFNTLLWSCWVEEPPGITVFGKLLTWEELLIGGGVGLAAGVALL